MNVMVAVRPGKYVIELKNQVGVSTTLNGRIFLGLNTHYFVTSDSSVRLEIIQESQIDSILPKRQCIFLTVKKEKINVLTEDGSGSILKDVHNDMIRPGENRHGQGEEI